MTEPVSIRSAERTDIDAVLALWRTSDVAPSRTDDVESVMVLLAHPTSTLLVAEADGRIAGSVIAAWNGWRGALYRLAVAPTHRRTGIATSLVRTAEEALTRHGARRFHALVLDDADDARGFWEAARYERHPNASLLTRNDP